MSAHPQDFVRASFEITHDTTPPQHLIAGFSSFGLAGLTAVDYLVKQLDLDVHGHISADALPAITPFEAGTPRHHTRIYGRDDLEVSVLQNELFVPPWAADALSEAVLSWTDDSGIEEVSVLSGVPIPHGPDDHRTYYVASEDYRAARLDDASLPGMGAGFLEGVNAALVGRGMESSLRVGVLITPVHAQAPDVEAAIRLVETAAELYDLTVDTGELAAFAEEVKQYYAELAARFERAEGEGRLEDQMFM
ncbi:MAG: proteasome assembly chaperone family protein [Salinirussus sp.]